MARRASTLGAAAALALLLTGAAAAQQQQDEIKASARLSRHLVKLGDDLRLVVEAEGTKEGQLISLPEVDGLDIGPVSSPIVTDESRIFNNRQYRRLSVAWVVLVRPQHVGEFEIPPVRLRLEGRELTVPDEPLKLRVVEDIQGAEHGFFEVQEAPERVYEGQPFDVDLRFGTDLTQAGNLGLYLPWWPGQRGVIELERQPGRTGNYFKLAVNDRYEVVVEQLPQEERQGVPFHVLRLARRYMATRPGTLEFDEPTFRFAEVLRPATVFDRGRYKDYFAQGPAFSIEVVPVPEEGRPFEWTGAVGKIRAERRVDRRDLDVGDTVELSLSWLGEGNFEYFDPPDLKRLDAFERFRVLSMEDHKFTDERRVVWDLVPARADIDAIPPVPLWVFDPEQERYVLVESEPVPIRVRAVEGEDLGAFEPAEDEEVVDLRDLHTTPEGGGGLPVLGGRNLALAGAALPLAWLAARVLVRRRRGDPQAPLERRRRGARRRLARDLAAADSASGQAAALARFLAARTREPDHAWVGRDPTAWAAARGSAAPAPEVLAPLAQLFDELDRRAWAEGDEPLERERVAAVADALRRGGL